MGQESKLGAGETRKAVLNVVQARGGERNGDVGMASGYIALVVWMRLGEQLNIGQKGSNIQHWEFCSCVGYCEADM